MSRRVAAQIRVAMDRRGRTTVDLARELGCSDTSVREWRNGSTTPTIEYAERLAELLSDDGILTLTREARTGRCAYLPCRRSFDRLANGQKRRYCSARCRDRAHDHPERRADERQDAIDTFCRECEPEGICRTPACQLRPFSPLLFVPLRRAS